MLSVHLQAVIRGRNAVAAVSAREKIIASHLIALSNNPAVYSHQYAPDNYSQRLLRKYGSTQKTAVYTSADGNCLYQAVSLAVFGDTSASTELRARTAIELAINRQYYDGDEFRNVTDGYDSELNSVASPSQYAGVLAILALSVATLGASTLLLTASPIRRFRNSTQPYDRDVVLSQPLPSCGRTTERQNQNIGCRIISSTFYREGSNNNPIFLGPMYLPLDGLLTPTTRFSVTCG